MTTKRKAALPVQAGTLGNTATNTQANNIITPAFPQEPCPFCGSELHQKITITNTPSAEMLALMRQIVTGLQDIAWELSDKQGD